VRYATYLRKAINITAHNSLSVVLSQNHFYFFLIATELLTASSTLHDNSP